MLVNRLGGRIWYPIKGLLTALCTIELISELYYLSLCFKLSFWGLLLVLTLLNLAHLRWSLPWFRNYIRARRTRLGSLADSWPLLILSVSILLLTLLFIDHTRKWGGWDSFAIWTLHAKFLYYDQHWATYLSPRMAWSHPDYPLMLPSLIAFFWKSLGVATASVPAILCLAVLIAVPLTVFSGLYQNKNVLFAYTGLVIFIADTTYIDLASAQYADTLLALFILFALLLYKKLEDGGPGVGYLIGFVAAGAAWIKNEGQMFFVCFSAIFFLFQLRKPHRLVQYFLGALVPFAVLASFKFFYAPPGDLINPTRIPKIKWDLVQAERYRIVAEGLLDTIWQKFWLMLVLFVPCILLRAGRKRIFRSFSFYVLFLCLVAYYFIYVITPNELHWHLGSSADRIIHQLYPAVIFLELNQVKAGVDLQPLLTRLRRNRPLQKDEKGSQR